MSHEDFSNSLEMSASTFHNDAKDCRVMKYSAEFGYGIYVGNEMLVVCVSIACSIFASIQESERETECSCYKQQHHCLQSWAPYSNWAAIREWFWDKFWSSFSALYWEEGWWFFRIKRRPTNSLITCSPCCNRVIHLLIELGFDMCC